MEMRPWFAIERSWERDGYAAYGYYEDGEFAAYASFYSSDSSPYVLLDYLGVVPKLRGSGIGSAFLRDLLPKIPSVGGIFAEAESPSSAKDEEEKNIRKSRIAFYLRNGAVKTGVSCQLFGVDYNILYFPGNQREMAQTDFFDTVCSFYQDIYRPVYGRLCKPYRQ